MKNFPVDSLQPGMRFSAAVFFDGNNLLVESDSPLQNRQIEQLKKWNVDFVTTEGVEIGDQEPTAGVATHGPDSSAVAGVPDESTARSQAGGILDISQVDPVQKAITARYDAIVARLRPIFAAIGGKEKPDSQAVDRVVELIDSLVAEFGDDLIQFVLFGLQGECGLVENAVNGGVLALLVAGVGSTPKHKSQQIVTAAVLRDVGMVRIPAAITEKRGSLSPEELQVMRTHPVQSSKIVSRDFRYNEEIALIVLQHHERWDGTGYPRGIGGKTITGGARIVAVCDSFEAMVSQRAYREGMIGHAAVRNLLADNGRRFDPDVLRLFIKRIGIFPVGSVVLLNNSSIGRVVENHSQAPLRPKVKIMVDECGDALWDDAGAIVDLSTERRLFIARAVDPRRASTISMPGLGDSGRSA